MCGSFEQKKLIMRIKIATVLGARPQFIKSQPLSHLFEADNNFEEIVIHTGQHYDFNMYNAFVDELQLPKPDHYLGINGGSNIEQTSKMLSSLEGIFKDEKPNMILVYGDTNSTLAGALAARQMNIPVCHVEAGLRSFNNMMAEELNRIITDRISDLLFTPVSEADVNLANESLSSNARNVGDVMLDVLVQNMNLIDKSWENLSNSIGLNQEEYIYMTLHRAELVDDKVKLALVVRNLEQTEKEFVLPLHPRTEKNMNNFGLQFSSNVKVIEPQAYFNSLALVKNAKFVLTDSGGVQREAYMLNKKCFTLRNETEWVGTLKGGCNQLISPEDNFNQVFDFQKTIKPNFIPIFGDGSAAIKIFNALKEYFGL